jgi:hypothetical protein
MQYASQVLLFDPGKWPLARASQLLPLHKQQSKQHRLITGHASKRHA